MQRQEGSSTRSSTDRMIRQLRRSFVFTLGVFIMALGVAVSVRANLGTSPIGSFPTVLSFATPLSVGAYLILLNLVFFLLQVLILRRKFPLLQLAQLPISLAFGVFTDIGADSLVRAAELRHAMDLDICGSRPCRARCLYRDTAAFIVYPRRRIGLYTNVCLAEHPVWHNQDDL